MPTTEFNIQPVSLYGRVVHLIPLSEEHIHDLAEAGKDLSIWQFMLYGLVNDEEQMRHWVHDILNRQALGTDLAFSVLHIESRRVIGATRYLDIHPEQRGLEIGGTWYATAHQRTAVNTESKYLLLKYAFESLGCIRVQFKTDLRNERSQRALERIGAVKEGILRNHMILQDGTYRHSVFYSILDNEWPDAKERLTRLLGYEV